MIPKIHKVFFKAILYNIPIVWVHSPQESVTMLPVFGIRQKKEKKSHLKKFILK